MNPTLLKDILTRIGYEDRKAFDQFFEHYYPRLLKFAVHYVKSYANAEEIVGDVFVKILKRKDMLGQIENFNGYIFQSVKNQALSFINKKKPDIFLTEDEEDYLMTDHKTPESEFLDQELSSHLTKAIDNLPAKRKMIYKLIKEDGLKYQEAADLLGVSVKTIEVHMGLAISNIREALKGYIADKKSDIHLRKLIPFVCSLIAADILLFL